MIYLDNAATTITDPEVIDVMATVMNNFFGNPSSLHEAGQDAKTIIEESRKTIAHIVNCEPKEIIFTSGGTEAINLIFYNIGLQPSIKHVITSPIEHPAVLYSLEQYGLAEKTEFLDILPNGTPDLDQLENMLSEMPGAFVALMHVNNECGSMLDVERAGAICKKYNALFFCDTVQAIGKTPVDLHGWNIDFAACSGHKFHGPRGIGFLYKHQKHHFVPQTVGGGQEGGLRSGTENTAAIAALCRALELADERMDETLQRMSEFNKMLVTKLTTGIPDIRFAGDMNNTLPHILSIAVRESDTNFLLTQQLSDHGFAVSSGSACHAGSKTSSLLHLMGMPGFFPLRVSFGKFTTTKEVELFGEILLKMLNE